MRSALLGLVALFATTAPALHAQTAAPAAKAPIVVEMFTSKFCPSCPMAESKLKSVANENPDLLVVFSHVDYWDRSPKQKDPFGLPELTQRQYDVAASLGRRPGEVFTPMPVLDGQIMAKPPLLFSWGSSLDEARQLPAKPALAVRKTADGDVEIDIPAALYGANREIWVLGLLPIEGSKANTVGGIAEGQMKTGTVRIPHALLPKGEKMLVLLQEVGPGKVVAVGQL